MVKQLQKYHLKIYNVIIMNQQTQFQISYFMFNKSLNLVMHLMFLKFIYSKAGQRTRSSDHFHLKLNNKKMNSTKYKIQIVLEIVFNELGQSQDIVTGNA